MLWLLTRFGSSAVALLSFLFSFMSYGKQAVTRHSELQAAVPTLFSFIYWQQRLALFYFVAGSHFACLCLQFGVLFAILVQTWLRLGLSSRRHQDAWQG